PVDRPTAPRHELAQLRERGLDRGRVAAEHGGERVVRAGEVHPRMIRVVARRDPESERHPTHPGRPPEWGSQAASARPPRANRPKWGKLDTTWLWVMDPNLLMDPTIGGPAGRARSADARNRARSARIGACRGEPATS